jgi:type IV pilus assembly protein PilY1
MVQQTITKSATTATLTANPVPSSANGWYIDFPDDGERSVTNPILSGGVLVFTSNTPIGGNAAQCIPGGSSWVWFVDYATGGRITLAGSSAHSGQFVGNVLSSRPVLVRLPDGNIVGLIRGSDSQTRTVDPPNNTAATVGRRLSWREIVQ